MKKINIFRLSVVIFTLTLIFSAITYAKVTQSNIADNLFRLHIIANSNHPSDQNLKLKVRDRILRESETLFKNSQSAKESAKIARENLDFLEKIALDEIKNQGYDYRVKIEIGEFPFPVKTYDNIILPSGKYQALKIIIGQGKGENWWCVMFPPMCSIDNLTIKKGKKDLRNTLSQEEFDLISTNKANIRFKIVDIINSIVN